MPQALLIIVILMIRLLHSSDWHLGRHLFGRSLLEDQAYALDRLLELITELRPHGLLIAGDVFDRSVPPEEAVVLLNRFLTRVINETSTPVFLIPGNHDSKERLGFAASLLRDHKLAIFSRIEDALKPVTLRGEQGEEILIYGIPFVEPAEIAHALDPDLLGTELARSHDLALKALCEKMLAARPASAPAVLLCHAFVMGGEISESEKEIAIGGSSQVGASAFSGFAYTALGHLHKPQTLSGADDRSQVRYSGSLLHYSKSEIGHTKTITEVRLHFDGGKNLGLAQVELVHHPLKALRELRYIEGELQALIAGAANDKRRDDYILAGYTDRGAVLDTFAKLRVVYPNLLHVSRAGGFLPDALPAATRARQEMSELDLFSDFFRSATGQELSDDERAALIESLTSVKQGEEA